MESASATEVSLERRITSEKRSLDRDGRLIQAALGSNDYRSFIVNVATTQARNGKMNMAALSRKAGFSSRSFIGDVIEGRRRLSPSSYPKLARALSLSARLRSYFHLLAVRDEPDLNFEQLDQHSIEFRLKELRLRLQNDLDSALNKNKKAETLLKARDMMDCYAALGNGATIEEVASRTGLSINYVKFVLEHFLSNATAKLVNGKYIVDNPVVLFNDLGESQNAKSCYLQTVNELKRKADSGFHNVDRAFSQFVFTVDSSKMPELKKKLWETMREFMESSEVSDGDRVAKLAVGFYI